MLKANRTYGFIVIFLTYILAIAAGAAVFFLFDSGSVYIRILYADIAATVIVYLSGILFQNASIYDPYWSVQPIVILLGLIFFYENYKLSTMLLLLAICFWGVRLTANWAGTFVNLKTQDWRYDMFKEKNPRLFPLISFAGIHMFPTIVVYFAVLPAMAVIEQNANSVNFITILGFVMCVLATLIQVFSDRQMRQFQRQRKSNAELIRVGLWKYSRHPNYLGEILMWWGVYILMLSVLPEKWYLGIGAFINTLMFFCISIPMADKRNSRKPGFEQYCKETRSLLPMKRYNETHLSKG